MSHTSNKQKTYYLLGLILFLVGCSSNKSFFSQKYHEEIENPCNKRALVYYEIRVYQYNYYIFQKNYQYEMTNHFGITEIGRWNYDNDTLVVFSPEYFQDTRKISDSLNIIKLSKDTICPYRQFTIRGNKLIECTDYTKFFSFDENLDSTANLFFYQKAIEHTQSTKSHYLQFVRQ